MTYKSASALEMAVKAAASASPLDTGRAISAFYFHRLLCRIFADFNTSFVLKGGQAMLARTVNARATRDIDLLAWQSDLDNALKELIGLAERDLDDFITFEYAGAHPIKTEAMYRSGLSVKFIPIIGTKHMQQISIDLVVDDVPLGDVDLVTPADRIEVEGLQTFDYLVYPIESALADKICALIEVHDGRPSSRVKDLVDIAVYATTCAVDGEKLRSRVRSEADVRGIQLPDVFEVPEGWSSSQARQFEKLCANTGLPSSLKAIDASAELACRLFEPVFNAEARGLYWNSSELMWR